MDKRQKIKTLIAVASCSTAIAFFSYKFYKEYKFQKEAMKESEEILNQVELSIDQREAKKALDELEAKLNSEDDEEYEPEYIDERDLPEEEYMEDEERMVEELRYDPNSPEAAHQYQQMMLSDFDALDKDRRTLEKLFKIPFRPTNDLDGILDENIISDKAEFFGEDSVHLNKTTMADVILYMGKVADYDLDMGVEYWVHLYLYNLGLNPGMGNATLSNIVDTLCKHGFYGDEGYGMFGLNDEEYTELINKCSDSPVSFMKQYYIFNERMLQEVE